MNFSSLFLNVAIFFQLLFVQKISLIFAHLLEPEFMDPIENVTAIAGRNMKFACSVKNIGTYKIAWMHYEKSAILAVHNHVITRNHRIGVSHDKRGTWFLHINNVQEEDKGRYMCQINTVVVKKQFGYLHVVVSPNIDDSQTSTDMVVSEGDSKTLVCKATGLPPPKVKWKRNNREKIRINQTLTVTEWKGERLQLSQISRLDMGVYMCIASNGIPPTVSKMIRLNVEFPPNVWIPHQLVAAPLASNVTIECITEAYPMPLNYWLGENNKPVHGSDRVRVENGVGNVSYKTLMKLTIVNISIEHFGAYKCISQNSQGEMNGIVRIYVSESKSTTTVRSLRKSPSELQIERDWDDARKSFDINYNRTESGPNSIMHNRNTKKNQQFRNYVSQTEPKRVMSDGVAKPEIKTKSSFDWFLNPSDKSTATKTTILAGPALFIAITLLNYLVTITIGFVGLA